MYFSVFGSLYPLLTFGFVMSVTGIALAYFNAQAARKFGQIILAVSVGALLAVAVFHMVPDAVTLGNGGWMLSGLILSLWIGQMTLAPAGPLGVRARGILPPLLLGLHSMVDGLTYDIAVSSSGPQDGMMSMLGLAMHEFPEGVAAFFLLSAAGLNDRHAAWAALALVGLTTPVGAFLSSPLMLVFDEHQLNSMFGFVSGLIVAVVIRLLQVSMPAMPVRTSVPSLGAGMAIALVFLLGHQH